MDQTGASLRLLAGKSEPNMKSFEGSADRRADRHRR